MPAASPTTDPPSADGAAAPGTLIGVRYLTGYAAAGDGKGGPEWPPHPARLFMALVAALHDGDAEADEHDALLWLEQQAAPTLWASSKDVRPTVETYVPPNDFTLPRNVATAPEKSIATAINVLPQRRTKRQPRTFPRVRPRHDTVHFGYVAACPHRDALDRLCGRVARLGHSMSLVQVWLGDDAAATEPGEDDGRLRLEPNVSAGGRPLRVVQPGLLDYLHASYNAEAIERHHTLDGAVRSAAGPTPAKAKAARKAAEAAYESATGRAWKATMPAPHRARPEVYATATYGPRPEESAGIEAGAFDPTLVIYTLKLAAGEKGMPRLTPRVALEACAALRLAVIKAADRGNGVPDFISGHDAQQRPTTRPHLAYFPLLFCGHERADGRPMGLAVARPRGLDHAETTRIHAALSGLDELVMGRLGKWRLLPVPWDNEINTLASATWSGRSRGSAAWGTATPVALDRYPRGRSRQRRAESAAGLIADACELQELPRPVEVSVFDLSPFPGAPSAAGWPKLDNKRGGVRPHVHARILFAQPVRGPLLLGAGRYRGWGVCRPLGRGGAA